MDETGSGAGGTDLASQFAARWDQENVPDVFGFLADYEASPREQLDVLLVDQSKRWRAGCPLSVDEYFNKCPVVSADADLKLELLREEFGYLESQGGAPAVNEFAARFSDLQTQLMQTLSQGRPEPDTIDMSVSPESTAGGSDKPKLSSAATVVRLPQRFGDYELTEEIARGGMGVVYKALQVPLNRPCALKMILVGRLAGEQEVKRFHTEAEAAANLDHANIVPVYEVGEHDGHHFFSMGYVEGKSMAELLKDGPLAPHEAAELVKTIAEAVAYAHGKGVIHRDLKPGNVLIDHDGKPRITDFGLAKRTETDGDLTASGQILGTPSYMPPEQAMGRLEQVGPGSDVYALGAILYCTLTGRPPFQAASIVETLRQVTDQEPVSPRQLNPTVDRDLETITMKCLEKEPHRRYASAADLADELGRFQRIEPTIARPLGRVHRMWRWGKRNKALAGFWTAAITLLVMLAAGGPLVAWWQAELRWTAVDNANRAGRAEQQAIRNYEEARSTIDQYVETVQNAELLKQRQFKPLLKDLLQDALLHYERFIDAHGHDSSSLAELAKALSTVALINYQSGDLEQAIQSYEECRRLLDQLVAENPGETKYASRLAAACHNIAMAFEKNDRLADAEKALQRALELYSRLARQNPAKAAYEEDLAGSHLELGNHYRKIGSLTQANAQYQQSLEIRRRLADEHPSVDEYRHGLAGSYYSVGLSYEDMGRREEALVEYEEGRGILEDLLQEEPDSPEYLRGLGLMYNGIGRASERPQDAETAHQRALEIHERLVREHPTISAYENHVVSTYISLGKRYNATKRFEESLASYQSAIDIGERLVRENPTNTSYENDLSKSYNGLGLVYSESGHPEEAAAAYRRVVEIREKLLQYNSESTDYLTSFAGVYVNMAILRMSQPDVALEHLGKAMPLLNSVLEREPNDATANRFLVNAHGMRAMVLQEAARYDEAADDWQIVASRATGVLQAVATKNLGLALARAGHHDRAVRAIAEMAGEPNKYEYDLACVYALCARAAAQDSSLDDDARDEWVESHASAAVRMLGQASALGYFAGPEERQLLHDDADLESIRERIDFRELVEQIKIDAAKTDEAKDVDEPAASSSSPR